MKEQKIKALRQWMIKQGCKIHPNITIPSSINGVQGISSNNPIPHKTIIIAVPSKLMLTVSKCYNDPKLKKLYLANDDLFDYQSSEDAQFNILCVFLMYHKMSIQNSEWKQYLQTIAQPQTAIDWKHSELKGLNKSIIQQIIHVQIQCTKLQNKLIQYLTKRKQFKHHSQQLLRKTFNYCYKAVLTRCFGYYFDQTCLIPIADLINHGCQCVDHQLLNVQFQNSLQVRKGYEHRKNKINCDLLGIQSLQNYNLPFRQKFLIDNNIIQNNLQTLCDLNRLKINQILYSWNKERLINGVAIDDLQFCSQNEEQDNDTDQQFESEQIKEMDYYKKTQQQQMGQFMNNYVKIERYIDVQSKLQQLDDNKSNQKDQIIKNAIQSLQPSNQVKIQKDQQIYTSNLINSQEITQSNKQQSQNNQKSYIISKEQVKNENPFSNAQGKGVPIKLMNDSQSQDQSDHDQWFMNQSSYFTMSTSSPIAANREVLNSYGSRTNRFLLIWYGFTYSDNLYDSVSFRLQVQFNKLRPAKEIVLDSYVGGQGLSFKKPDLQTVKQTEISKQFRLKRSNICDKLLTFLRLYLMNFYQQNDLYKLFITFPASITYELFIFKYYKQIIQALYDRYPLSVIQQLKNDYEAPQNQKIKFKIKYKIIYLEDQRKLLDLNLQAIVKLIQILEMAKLNGGIIQKNIYKDVDIRILRVIRKYLITYQNYIQYIVYRQEDKILLQQEENQKSDKNHSKNIQQQCLIKQKLKASQVVEQKNLQQQQSIYLGKQDKFSQ